MKISNIKMKYIGIILIILILFVFFILNKPHNNNNTNNNNNNLIKEKVEVKESFSVNDNYEDKLNFNNLLITQPVDGSTESFVEDLDKRDPTNIVKINNEKYYLDRILVNLTFQLFCNNIISNNPQFPEALTKLNTTIIKGGLKVIPNGINYELENTIKGKEFNINKNNDVLLQMYSPSDGVDREYITKIKSDNTFELLGILPATKTLDLLNKNLINSSVKLVENVVQVPINLNIKGISKTNNIDKITFDNIPSDLLKQKEKIVLKYNYQNSIKFNNNEIRTINNVDITNKTIELSNNNRYNLEIANNMESSFYTIKKLFKIKTKNSQKIIITGSIEDNYNFNNRILTINKESNNLDIFKTHKNKYIYVKIVDDFYVGKTSDSVTKINQGMDKDMEIILTQKLHRIDKSYMDVEDSYSLSLKAQNIEIYLLEELNDNIKKEKSNTNKLNDKSTFIDYIKFGGLDIEFDTQDTLIKNLKSLFDNNNLIKDKEYIITGSLYVTGTPGIKLEQMTIKYDGNNISGVTINKKGILLNINIDLNETFDKKLLNTIGESEGLYDYALLKKIVKGEKINDTTIKFTLNNSTGFDNTDYVYIGNIIFNITKYDNTNKTIEITTNNNTDKIIEIIKSNEDIIIIKKNNIALKDGDEKGNIFVLKKKIPEDNKIIFPTELKDKTFSIDQNNKYTFEEGVVIEKNTPIFFIPKSNKINDLKSIYKKIKGFLLFNVMYQTNIIYSIEPIKKNEKYIIHKYQIYKNNLDIILIRYDGKIENNNLLLNKFINIQLITDYQEKKNDSNINIFNNYCKIIDSTGKNIYFSDKDNSKKDTFLNSTIVNIKGENNVTGINIGHENNSKIYKNVYVSIKDLYFTRLNRGENGNYKINRNNQIILSTLNQHILVNRNRNLNQIDTLTDKVNLPLLEPSFYRHTFDNNMFSFLQLDKRLSDTDVYSNNTNSKKFMSILTNYDSIYNEYKDDNDKAIKLEDSFMKIINNSKTNLLDELGKLKNLIGNIKTNTNFVYKSELNKEKIMLITFYLDKLKNNTYQDNSLNVFINKTIKDIIDEKNYTNIKGEFKKFNDNINDLLNKNSDSIFNIIDNLIKNITKINTSLDGGKILNYITFSNQYINTIDNIIIEFNKILTEKITQFIKTNNDILKFKTQSKILKPLELKKFEEIITKQNFIAIKGDKPNTDKNKTEISNLKILFNLIRGQTKEIFEVINRYKTFEINVTVKEDIKFNQPSVDIDNNFIDKPILKILNESDFFDIKGTNIKNVLVKKNENSKLKLESSTTTNITKGTYTFIVTKPNMLYELNKEFLLETDSLKLLGIDNTKLPNIFSIKYETVKNIITTFKNTLTDELGEIMKSRNKKEEFQDLKRRYEIINKTRSIYKQTHISLLCKSRATGGDFVVIYMKIKFNNINLDDYSETFNIEVHRTRRNKNFDFIKDNNVSVQKILKIKDLPFEKNYYEKIVKPIVENELGLNIYHFMVYDINKELKNNEGIYYNIVNEYIKFNPLLNVLKFDFSNLTFKQLKLDLNLKFKVGEDENNMPRYIIFKEVHNSMNNNKVDVNITRLNELKKMYPEFYAKCILNIMNNIKGKLIKCNSWGFGTSKIKRLTNDNCKNLTSYFQFFEDITNTEKSHLGKTITTKTTVNNIVSTLTYDGDYYPKKSDVENQFNENSIDKKLQSDVNNTNKIVINDVNDLKLNMKVNINGINKILFITKIENNTITLNTIINKLESGITIKFIKNNVYFSNKYKINNMYPYLYFNNQTDICYLDKNFIERKFNGEFMLQIINTKNILGNTSLINNNIIEIIEMFSDNDKLPGGPALYKLVEKEILDDIERQSAIKNKIISLYNLDISNGIKYENTGDVFLVMVNQVKENNNVNRTKLIEIIKNICDFILTEIKDLYWINNQHPDGGEYKCNLLPDITKLKVEKQFLSEEEAKIIQDTYTGTEKPTIEKIRKDNVQLLLSKESIGFEGDQELGSMNADTGCNNPNLNIQINSRPNNFYSKYSRPAEHFQGNIGDIKEDFNNIQLMSSKSKVDNLPSTKKNKQYVKSQCQNNKDGNSMITGTSSSCNTKIGNQTVCDFKDTLNSITGTLASLVSAIGDNNSGIVSDLNNLKKATGIGGSEKTGVAGWVDSIKNELLGKGDSKSLRESINASIASNSTKIADLKKKLLGDGVNKGKIGELEKSIKETFTDNNSALNQLLKKMKVDIEKLDCVVDGSCPASSTDKAIFDKVKNLEVSIKEEISTSSGTLQSELSTKIKDILNDENTLKSVKDAAKIINRDKDIAKELQANIKEMKGKIEKIEKQTGEPAESERQKNNFKENIKNTENIINKLSKEIKKKGTTVSYLQSIILNPNLITDITITPGPAGQKTSLSQIRIQNKNRSEESQIKEINDKLLGVLQQISSGYVKVTNKSEVDKQLRMMNGMIDILKKKEGNVDNTSFLQKLLLTTQMQMNNLVNNVKNQKTQSHSHSDLERSMSTPHLPTITQFKPEGTSNIFSPLIDIKTNSKDDNKKFMDAFERGFDKGIEEGGDKSRTTYDMSKTYIDDKDKYESKQVTTRDINTVQGYSDKLNSNYYSNQKTDSNIRRSEENKEEQESYNDSENTNTNTNTTNTTNTTNSNNKLGIPGYSYLDPKLFNIPQRRNPVCINTPKVQRGNSALEPAGYMSGGFANVMEFQGVGSILPKFEYKQNRDNIPDKTNRI